VSFQRLIYRSIKTSSATQNQQPCVKCLFCGAHSVPVSVVADICYFRSTHLKRKSCYAFHSHQHPSLLVAAVRCPCCSVLERCRCMKRMCAHAHNCMDLEKCSENEVVAPLLGYFSIHPFPDWINTVSLCFYFYFFIIIMGLWVLDLYCSDWSKNQSPALIKWLSAQKTVIDGTT